MATLLAGDHPATFSRTFIPWRQVWGRWDSSRFGVCPGDLFEGVSQGSVALAAPVDARLWPLFYVVFGSAVTAGNNRGTDEVVGINGWGFDYLGLVWGENRC